MAGKREKPEDIVLKLRQVEVLQGQGMSVQEAVRQIGVSVQTYYRWRKEYGDHSLSISAIPKVLWRRIYREEGARLDRCRGRKDRVHRARLALGKWLLRKLQCTVSGRAAERRGLLHPT